MQNYTAEYELSMKYQHAVHTGDTGCVWSLQPEQSSKDWKLETNKLPTGITVQKRNWNWNPYNEKERERYRQEGIPGSVLQSTLVHLKFPLV